MKRAVRLVMPFLIACSLLMAANLSVCSNSAPAYIGNLRSHVFHRQTCRYLPAAKNRTYFDTRTEAVDGGYRPCRKCKP